MSKRNLTKKQEQFISSCVGEMIKKEISVSLLHTKKVYSLGDASGSSGYFDEINKVFSVATDYPTQTWFETFTHEYCHFKQYINNTKIWNDKTLDNGKDSLELLFNWIEGKGTLSVKTATDCMSRAQKIELDCERRTFKVLSENKLTDTTNYIQKANSYILFYPVLVTHKKWYKKAPYLVKSVWSKAPKTFVGVDYSYPSDELLKAYETYCF